MCIQEFYEGVRERVGECVCEGASVCVCVGRLRKSAFLLVGEGRRSEQVCARALTVVLFSQLSRLHTASTFRIRGAGRGKAVSEGPAPLLGQSRGPSFRGQTLNQSRWCLGNPSSVEVVSWEPESAVFLPQTRK